MEAYVCECPKVVAPIWSTDKVVKTLNLTEPHLILRAQNILFDGDGLC